MSVDRAEESVVSGAEFMRVMGRLLGIGALV
jgi:hypothetical protein